MRRRWWACWHLWAGWARRQARWAETGAGFGRPRPSARYLARCGYRPTLDSLVTLIAVHVLGPPPGGRCGFTAGEPAWLAVALPPAAAAFANGGRGLRRGLLEFVVAGAIRWSFTTANLFCSWRRAGQRASFVYTLITASGAEFIRRGLQRRLVYRRSAALLAAGVVCLVLRCGAAELRRRGAAAVALRLPLQMPSVQEALARRRFTRAPQPRAPAAAEGETFRMSMTHLPTPVAPRWLRCCRNASW
jgi:hypothetical protein